VAGSEIATVIEGLLRSAYHPNAGILASTFGFAAMFVGASGVFVELRDTLNYIWNVPVDKGQGVWALVRERFFSFAMVLGAGFLLTASVAVSAVIQAAAAWCGECRSLPLPAPLLALSGFIVSLAVTSFLFALIYRVIPEARVDWRDVAFGAVLTALLFSAGRFLIGLYLAKAGRWASSHSVRSEAALC
jgi:membrane protein